MYIICELPEVGTHVSMPNPFIERTLNVRLLEMLPASRAQYHGKQDGVTILGRTRPVAYGINGHNLPFSKWSSKQPFTFRLKGNYCLQCNLLLYWLVTVGVRLSRLFICPYKSDRSRNARAGAGFERPGNRFYQDSARFIRIAAVRLIHS
jgi:hypothetical protein